MKWYILIYEFASKITIPEPLSAGRIIIVGSFNKSFIAFRFVDNVWGLWSDGLDSLKDFHRVANSIHPRIQFDLRYSTEKL